ncbi:MAG: hypothetical protein WC047_08260 [Kiritimatiellales bacterium]
MTVYDTFDVIERKLWVPFGYAMRMNAAQVTERAIIFGLYSGAYQNGKEYLTAWDAFELALIVDEYNQKMAGLDAEEQNFILDMAAKRYSANVDRVILDLTLETKAAGIAVETDLWDAKLEALSTDRAALLTLQARLSAKEKEIAARIMVLRAQIETEIAERELVDLEIAEKELAIVRVETELVRKGTELSLKETELIEKDLAILMKAVELARKNLELLSKTHDVSKIQLSEAEVDLKKTETGLEVSRIQLQITEAGLKALDAEKEALAMGIQTAGYEADIAKTTLIQVDLAEAELETMLARVDLDEQAIRVTEAATDVRKVELQQVELGLDRLEAEKTVANIAVDILQTKEKIAQTGILEAELEADQAKLEAETERLALYDSKITVIDAKRSVVEAETSAAGTELANEATMHTARTAMADAEHQMKMDTLANNKTETFASLAERKAMAKLGYDLAASADAAEQTLADMDVSKIEAETEDKEKLYRTLLAVEEDIMEADITTTLTHSIGTT